MLAVVGGRERGEEGGRSMCIHSLGTTTCIFVCVRGEKLSSKHTCYFIHVYLSSINLSYICETTFFVVHVSNEIYSMCIHPGCPPGVREGQSNLDGLCRS